MWTKYYKLPLKGDGMCCYAFDAANEMALGFDYEIVTDRLQSQIIDLINGKDVPAITTLTQDCIEFKSKSGLIVFEVRGWGALTGIGGYQLDSTKAAKIQESFADFIFKQITKKQ